MTTETMTPAADTSETAETIRLNLGSGPTTIEGFTNVDASLGTSVYPLDYADESVDEIYASHILEHFGHEATQLVLNDWVRVLKPGGSIRIAVPNYEWIHHQWTNNPKQRPLLRSYLFGGHIDENDCHGELFTDDILRGRMTDAGLIGVCEWTSELQDCASLPVSLNLRGTRPADEDGEMTAVTEPIRFPDQWPIKNDPKIAVTLSQPRLGFTQQMVSMFGLLQTMKVDIIHHHGFPWEKVLTIGFEAAIDRGADYILCVDYDGLFTPDDVKKLVDVMQAHPELCAAYAVQMNRHKFAPIVRMEALDYSTKLTEVPFGHFGLTLIRADMFKSLPHPWFMSLPDPDTGEWNDRKTDADIFFWRDVSDRGGKVAQVNDVIIGHMDLMAIWPGDRGPVFQSIGEYSRGGKPSACLKHIGDWKGATNCRRVPSAAKGGDNGDHV